MADVNEQIGGYRLRSMLHTGATSQVFEVVEPTSNRHFAMKLLLPEAAGDSDQRRTLFNEAEVGIKLAHQNVIRIHKVNRSPETPHFIMEFFPAGALGLRLRGKDMKFIKEHARKIIKEAATGLAYMNANNYIHRDIKPDNILANSVGDTKIIDFAITKKPPTGLAKLFRRRGKPQGTPSYMSPEQIRDEVLDGRADVYSFGCTIYELLTGRKPLTGQNQTDLLSRQLVEKPPPPSAHNKDLTDEFSALVSKMLAKKKEDRPASFHEFLISFRKVKIYHDEKVVDEEQAMVPRPLPFEQDIHELEQVLAQLETAPEAPGAAESIRRMRRELANLKKERYANLTAWETVLVARHEDRPQTMDYVGLIFDEFDELHGDKAIGDDRAIRTGFARLGDYKVMLVGHQKGRTTAERSQCFFGCAHPEGYRKALSKMKLAAKFGLPVICLIDTPGAFPGIGAEERGQSQLIATSILEMSRLPTPVVCVVIGEGGSGGALGIGVGDRVSMLQYAYYSVISPEGCAGILWKVATEQTKPTAAAALRLTAADLVKLNVIDHVIPEPLGFAHRSPREMANTLRTYLVRQLRELSLLDRDSLLKARYAKFRAMGIFETA